MNKTQIEINGVNYMCFDTFDTELGNGVDVLDADEKKFVGECWGISIPDKEDEAFSLSMEYFVEYIKNDLSL